MTISLQDSTRPPTSWAICSCCCQDDIPSLLASASRCLYQSLLSPPFFKSFPRGFQGIVRFCSVTCIVYAFPFPSSFHVSTLESTYMKKQKQKQNKTNINVILRLSKIKKMKSCYHMKDLHLLLQFCTFIDKGCGCNA